MEHTPESEDSTPSASPLEDAAQKALLESGLPATDYNAAIVAEVAAAAGETGLVEASKVADRVTDEHRANDVLRVIARAAIHTDTLAPAVRRDLIIMLTSGRSGEEYRRRRLENSIRRAVELEVSVRRSNRRKSTS